MARKTFKRSGPGCAGWGCFLVLVAPAIGGFCAFAAVFIGAWADGGADSNASESMRTGIVGMVMTVVFLAFMAATGLALKRKAASYPGVIAGLQVWAARHGWEVTDDPTLAAHWATRFHFSDDDLTRPFHAARGWVHGRDAMILLCRVTSGEYSHPETIIVVDADADYPVTAVVPRRSASAGSHAYGSAVPLESVEFERRWRAMGRYAAGSHAVFTPRVIGRLLEPTPGGQPEIVWDGPGIRAADNGLIADPMHLESRLLLLADLAGLTPAYQVTHTNDDPSLGPYVPPPTGTWTWTITVDEVLQMGGIIVWVVGIGMIAPVLNEIWVAAVSLIVGLTLFLCGVRLKRVKKARQEREWRAAHASALGPPPTS